MAFYITKVTATGTSKPPATVTFNKGLNIICGVSDSGKTCALKCIQFAMGVIKKPFEKEQTGYDGPLKPWEHAMPVFGQFIGA